VSKTNGSQELQRSLSQHRLSRARFLRLLGGTGAGLSLLPASLSCSAGESSAQAAATVRRPAILTGERYPIGFWGPPPPAKTSVYRYREIAEAGFNFVVGSNGVTTDFANRQALEAAAENNLRYILQDYKLNEIVRRNTSFTDRKEALRRRINELLDLFGNYQALDGLVLYDEPSSTDFPILGFGTQKLGELAPGQLPYVNLYSARSLNNLGTRTYAEYVERYLKTVKPPVLCFSHYPLLEGTKITRDYFYNWALNRRFALRFGIPSWVFIQSIFFDNDGKKGPPFHRRPNEAEIRWQVNVSLAYGAKGIQYFTYWTRLSSSAQNRYGEGLISAGGERSETYEYAKRINGYLEVVGKVLLPLRSESVTHARESPLPRGATAFRGDRYVKSASGSPVILGRFRKPGVENQRYLFVANRSFSKRARTRLTLTDSVGKVFAYDVSRRTFVGVSRNLQPTLQPGGARLYMLRTR
jgi:hypothetical protein